MKAEEEGDNRGQDGWMTSPTQWTCFSKLWDGERQGNLACYNAGGVTEQQFIGRTDAEAEGPILWPPHAKSQLIGKDSDAGKD